MSYQKRKNRTYRRTTKPKVPKPYKSWLEHDLHKGALKNLPYEPELISYTIPKRYRPDFVNYDKGIIFEAKGRFQDSAEASKYVHFRKCNPEWEIIFIFERPRLAMPHAKKRKDGTKMTHAEWAEKNGFKWCSKEHVNKEWL